MIKAVADKRNPHTGEKVGISQRENTRSFSNVEIVTHQLRYQSRQSFKNIDIRPMIIRRDRVIGVTAACEIPALA